MAFYADLHIHSKYSRATSRDCDLEHMAYWATRKGVSVIATGDFTHPKWFEEIQEKLVPAEPGLYRLKPELEKQVKQWLDDQGGVPTTSYPTSGGALNASAGRSGDPGAGVRFMLEVEISTIYKKDDKTRKVHHLIYAPDLDQAGNIVEKLSRIGNIASDGRPILGLDSRDLLEITLESGPGCYLIPAHIWTPWFAVLGSKSGFDTIDHCYGDLTQHIFAVETGLSSDPPMNWRLSGLDRYTLVSNSDAHSPPKIGREACVFETDLDYFAMRRALETGVGFGGTVEFFPEEGKYHLDGHRKCDVCLTPQESRRNNNLCPVCGKPVTLGVLHRVNELADRPPSETPKTPEAPDTPHALGVQNTSAPTPEQSADDPTPPPTDRADYRSLVPLAEVISEIEGVGAKSKRVQRKYDELVARLGAELFILEQAPLEDVKRHSSSLLAEAIARIRQGSVIRESGYDGEYGTIRCFTKEELSKGAGVSLLFESTINSDETPAKQTQIPDRHTQPASDPSEPAVQRQETINRATPPIDKKFSPSGETPKTGPHTSGGDNEGDGLDPDQMRAVSIVCGPLLIIAGPGTGKTRTLTHRIAHLIKEHSVEPARCLAITFTHRAAQEMRDRLHRLLVDQPGPVPVMTFHALGWSILQEHRDRLGLPDSPRVARQEDRLELIRNRWSVSDRKAARWLKEISLRKRQAGADSAESRCSGSSDDPPVDDVTKRYQQQLRAEGLIDFDDLLLLPLELLTHHADLVEHYRSRYQWVSVDEYQDIDHLQYRLIQLLVPGDGNLCVIGDPDQAIYSFRGSDVAYFERFGDDYPNAQTVHLTRNYRSTRPIIDASLQLIAPSSLVSDRRLDCLLESPDLIQIRPCASDRGEAEFVVHTIEKMIGGSTFFSMDSGRVESHEGGSFSFSDFAVLYRTDAQSAALTEALARSGMPFQKRSHQSLADEPTVAALLAEMADAGTDDGRQTTHPPSVLERLAAAGKRLDDQDDTPLLGTYLSVLRPLARRAGADLSLFMTDLAMGVDVDLWDPRADRVSLLTLHAAKGLEFPVVFMVGCEDGILPLRWGSQEDVDLDEERRLFFVGMTRAQRHLFLTHADKRSWRGKIRPMRVSPFLESIEERLMEIHRHRGVRKRKAQQDQLALFPS